MLIGSGCDSTSQCKVVLYIFVVVFTPPTMTILWALQTILSNIKSTMSDKCDAQRDAIGIFTILFLQLSTWNEFRIVEKNAICARIHKIVYNIVLFDSSAFFLTTQRTNTTTTPVACFLFLFAINDISISNSLSTCVEWNWITLNVLKPIQLEMNTDYDSNGGMETPNTFFSRFDSNRVIGYS